MSWAGVLPGLPARAYMAASIGEEALGEWVIHGGPFVGIVQRVSRTCVAASGS